MISRKGLIDKIYKKYPFSILGKLSGPKVLQGIINVIHSMPKEDEWINVSDKLPDKDTLVLLKFDKDEYNRIHNGNYQKDYITTGLLRDYDDNHSHWYCHTYFDEFGLTNFIPVQWKKINL